MSLLMRDWILRDIEGSLADALDWLKSLKNWDYRKDAESDSFRYVDKKLEVKLNTSGGLIRVFGARNPNKLPHCITISDGISDIAALFEPVSLKRVTKRDKMRVQEDLIGDLLAVVDCRLSKGNHEKRSPQSHPVENEETIGKLLSQVNEFMREASPDGNSQPLINSQTEDPLSTSTSCNFATQIPNKIKDGIDVLGSGWNAINRGVHGKDFLSRLQQEPRPTPRHESDLVKPNRPDMRFDTEASLLSDKDKSLNSKPLGIEHKKALQAEENASISRNKSVDISLRSEAYPFQLTSRFVPRRYERIPKDQKELLDRDDSWFPSPYNHVSIPPKVLQDQLHFHDSRRAAHASIARDDDGNEKGNLQTRQNVNEDSEQGDHDVEAQSPSLVCDENNRGSQREELDRRRLIQHELSYNDQQSPAVSPPAAKTAYTDDDTVETDYGETSEDESEFSCPSPAANSRPRQQHTISRQASQTENDISERSPEQVSVTPICNPANENTLDIASSTDKSQEPASEAFRKPLAELPTPSTILPEYAVRSAIPMDPLSSPEDEDELELEIPHALGDQIQSNTVSPNKSSQLSSQNPPTASQPNLNVQVEKTPSQKRRFKKEIFSDIVIPGTYPSPQKYLLKDDLELTKFSPSTRSPQVPMTTPQMSQIDGGADERSRDMRLHELSQLSQHHESAISPTLLRSNPSSPNCQQSSNEAASHEQLPPKQESSRIILSSGYSIVPVTEVAESSRKRRKITDLADLGFSQEEIPSIDRDQMVKECRRNILRDISASSGQPRRIDELVLQNVPTRQDAVDSIASSSGNHSSETIIDRMFLDHSNMPQIDGPSNSEELGAEASQPEPMLALFEEYCSTYPHHRCSEKQFIIALVYIEWLTSQYPFHESLWDDFVRCYTQEYPDYVRRTPATKRISGIMYYNRLKDFDTAFFHASSFDRVVTQESLEATLSDNPLHYDLIERTREKLKAAARSSIQKLPTINDQETKRQTVANQTDSTIRVNTQIVARDVDEPKEPKLATRRFFETPSQIVAEQSARPEEGSPSNPIDVDLTPQKSARHLPWNKDSSSPTNSSRDVNSSPSEHARVKKTKTPLRRHISPIPGGHNSSRYHSPELPRRSRTLLEKSISPPRTSRSRHQATPGSNSLLQQRQSTATEEPIDPEILRKKELLGKVLARNRKRRGNLKPRSIPKILGRHPS